MDGRYVYIIYLDQEVVNKPSTRFRFLLVAAHHKFSTFIYGLYYNQALARTGAAIRAVRIRPIDINDR